MNMNTIASFKAALAAQGCQDSDILVYVSLKSPVEPPKATRFLLSDGVTYVIYCEN